LAACSFVSGSKRKTIIRPVTVGVRTLPTFVKIDERVSSRFLIVLLRGCSESGGEGTPAT
jgi:hypothetical protein